MSPARRLPRGAGGILETQPDPEVGTEFALGLLTEQIGGSFAFNTKKSGVDFKKSIDIWKKRFIYEVEN
jgi:hypothetical protein